MSQTWFTSDEHYGHANIIQFCHRPFTDTSHMREMLIKNHNEMVRPGDNVYHLGDMFWNSLTGQECLAIRSRLNGNHYYIMGNHEKMMNRDKVLRQSFIWVKDVENLKIESYPNIWLSHYAHRSWNGSHKGSYHLYGHTHNCLPQDGSLSFDVGVDAQNFYPIALEQVYKRMLAIKEQSQGKIWRCQNAPVCSNWFAATDSAPKTCAKCGTKMELK